MKKNCVIPTLIFVFATILCLNKNSAAQSVDRPIHSVEEAKLIVSGLIKQFADYFEKGDSIALAAMYTKDATLGSAHGKEIPAAIGGMIRSSIKNNSQHITYTSTSINVDGEFIIEVGYAIGKDDKGNQKYKFKYLVVYKQEDGQWKLYRDISL